MPDLPPTADRPSEPSHDLSAVRASISRLRDDVLTAPTASFADTEFISTLVGRVTRLAHRIDDLQGNGSVDDARVVGAELAGLESTIDERQRVAGRTETD